LTDLSVDDRADTAAAGTGAWFTTTPWSVVFAAGDEENAKARERLCQAYWYPLYAFARRQGCPPHDAQDWVQGFFAECLAKRWLGVADPDRGRFRSFLLVAFKRYQGREQKRRVARKRGGGRVIALDSLDAERRYALEPVDRLSADRLYDRRWALLLLERVLSQLEREQEEAGRTAAYQVLKEALTRRGGEFGLAELGRRLNLSEGAVKVAVHRLRRRYRELLDREIATTVGSSGLIEEERRELLAALTS
jgi:RNA polymerase sigma factor (sigma-70 family)